MKILHTADWHLGASLGGEKRFEEFDKLLEYICSIIKKRAVEAVIIAGDVFDSHMPPNRAAEQYYKFLVEAGRAGAGEIIVTGGNHDSTAYLEAPKEILKHLSVHVFASASGNCEDLIVPLKDKTGKIAALVGAVPYLHERDLVVVEGGQGLVERETALRKAMLDYYKKMATALNNLAADVPHIVTGHLFAVDDKKKNDSWTGTLMSVDTAEFPESIDYLALGHLHDARTLKTPHQTCVRYPGSPLNISFRELEVPKSVTIIDTDNIKKIWEEPLMAFQDMRVLEGSKAEIEAELNKLAAESCSVWCSVENTGGYEPGLAENLNEIIKGSKVKIISCRNRSTNPAVLQRLPEDRHLADLAPVEVFKLMLKENNIADESADQLLAAFNEIETAAREADK